MLLLKTGELLKENKQSYELKPSERFAEIKSYDEIYYSLGFLTSINHGELVNHISNERMIRKMRGYRIKNKEIIFPTKEYFEKGECGHLYNSIEDIANFNICKEKYSLDERLFYGVGISDDEYKDKMSKILFFTNNYCQNRMSILE